MISPVATILAVALVFYVIIPGVGAFGVRQRWRRFRRRLVEASLRAPVTYASVRTPAGAAASARFLGTLESIQGEHTAWIRNSEITVAVEMDHSDVYIVSQSDSDRREAPPARTSWSRVGSLPEGVKVLVSGRLDTTGAHPVIRGDAGEPVLAVFYDGPETTLVRHCIWSGRQLNEYWNSVTPGSLAGGTLALIVLAYLLLRQPMAVGYARLAIGLAAVPVLPLLPPGIVLFYLYRRSWRRGRLLRAHRDVLMVPLRYFTADERCAPLPTGELYCREERRVDALEASFAAGLTLIEPPVGERSKRRAASDGDPSLAKPAARCTVFGRPGGDAPVQPTDTLAEWIAVSGDPASASAVCQKHARRYELVSGVILGVGMLVNFVLVMVVLAATT